MIYVMRNGSLSGIQSGSQYDGSKTGGEFKKWRIHSSDPSEFVRETYGILSRRCATLYNTSAFARALVQKPAAYSIGKGVLFRSLPDASFLGMDREESVDWGRRFTSLLHYDKLAINYYQKQYELMTEQAIVGDSVLNFIREDNDLPFDLVTSSGATSIDWTKNDTLITSGIVHDEYLRRSGYVSGTTQKQIPFVIDGDQNAIQFFLKERPGQMRGYSVYYAAIAHLKNADRVWDATIERMVMEAIQMGYFTASKTDVGAQAAQMAAAARGRNSQSKSNELKEISGSYDQKVGGMYRLENDEAMQFTDLKTPSNNFGNANEWLIRLASMSSCYAPEFIKGEYSTSFTAHKGALNDTMKRIMFERQMFIRNVDNPVNLAYLKNYVRTGQLEVNPSFWTSRSVQMAYLNGKHLGEVPGHINPLQEINAEVKANEAGVLLKSDISQRFGHYDFTSMLDEWQEQQNAWWNASPEKQLETVKNDPTTNMEIAA